MLVKNGTAFIGGHFTRADVRVENGKIAQIGDLQPREGEEIRSAAGLYVLPGLVDIHIHAYAGADCMRGEDDVRRMSEGLLKTGVAAFMPTTMSAPNSTSDTGSPSKACTDCTRPEREMNVPTMTNAKVRHAHMTLQRLNAPRWRYTVKLWMSATPTSHDSKLAFSTASQPQ